MFYEDCVAAIDPNAMYLVDPMIQCNRLMRRPLIETVPDYQNELVESSGIGIGVVAVAVAGFMMLRG